MRPWLKNASPHCTPKGVRDQVSLILQGTDHQTKRAPISRRALFLGTALDTIPERCGGGR